MRLAMLSGTLVALCLPAHRALGSECGRASALATVVARAWTEGLKQEDEFRASVKGPHVLQELERRGYVLPDALRKRLARRTVYQVQIGPVPPVGMVVYGGTHFGLVDARSCELLDYGRGK